MDTRSAGTVPVLDSAATAAWAKEYVVPDPLGIHSDSPINATALAALVDADWVFARGLIESFTESANASLATISAVLESGDFLTLDEAAHVMKGASANLFATAAALAAEQLEAAAKSGDVARMHACAERLKVEVAKVLAYLKAWMELHEL